MALIYLPHGEKGKRHKGDNGGIAGFGAIPAILSRVCC
ncbi:hypothetical protein A4U88_3745 [Serratia marcescens]|nr:hypothetical protein A4U88_3745 [Serratia marcescens]